MPLPRRLRLASDRKGDLMASIKVESLGIEPGDLIEAVGKDGEAHRGKARLYNGDMYVGRSGNAVEVYIAHSYTVRIVEKAPKPIDKQTVRRVADFLRNRRFISCAEMVEEEFGEVDAF